MKQVKTRPLTRKQAAFVKHIVDNPKSSATEAARVAYDIKKANDPKNTTARMIASENLTKPNIKMALGEVNELLESTLINTVRDWGRSPKTREREIAQDAVKFAHDKIHGRAKQQIEMSSTSVSINIDLTGTDTTSPKPL